MKTLITVCIGILILLSSSSALSSNDSIPYYITDAAKAFKIDAALMYALCKVESNCRPKAINPNDGTKKQKELGIVIKSYGLFQLHVATAETLGFVAKNDIFVNQMHRGHPIIVRRTLNRIKDLLNPEINSWYAAKYLAKWYKKYPHNISKILSAYNNGSYTKNNIDYVNKVLIQYAKFKLNK